MIARILDYDNGYSYFIYGKISVEKVSDSVYAVVARHTEGFVIPVKGDLERRVWDECPVAKGSRSFAYRLWSDIQSADEDTLVVIRDGKIYYRFGGLGEDIETTKINVDKR